MPVNQKQLFFKTEDNQKHPLINNVDEDIQNQLGFILL